MKILTNKYFAVAQFILLWVTVLAMIYLLNKMDKSIDSISDYLNIDNKSSNFSLSGKTNDTAVAEIYGKRKFVNSVWEVVYDQNSNREETHYVKIEFYNKVYCTYNKESKHEMSYWDSYLVDGDKLLLNDTDFYGGKIFNILSDSVITEDQRVYRRIK